jgi:hypothetical protein
LLVHEYIISYFTEKKIPQNKLRIASGDGNIPPLTKQYKIIFMSDIQNQLKIAKALTDVGYSNVRTPPAERSVEVQCRWCLRSLKEHVDVDKVETIRTRVIHDLDCPVLLAHKTIEKLS